MFIWGEKNNFVKKVGLFSFIFIFTGLIIAQTTGKIAGYIRDAETNKPLGGVNVIVVGTHLGAATDDNGYYTVINIPPGKYEVVASMIGYEKVIKTNVIVQLDRITILNFGLRKTVIEGKEVVVVAERDILHKEVSNSQQVIDENQISAAAGIKTIKDFLSKQAGITDEEYIGIRGGSRDQTGTLVNGLNFVDAGLGRTQLTIPISAIQQISILTGGFNAEYGNFRSGLINVVTKTGSESEYHGTINFSISNGDKKRFGKSAYDPYNWILRTYFDPQIAFVGTGEGWLNVTGGDEEEAKYLEQQYRHFAGWNKIVKGWNNSYKDKQIDVMDAYLAAAWMYQIIPDFDALEAAGYTVSDTLKKALIAHANPGEGSGSDMIFDGGFGGPVPLIGKMLGNATFYLSNQTKREYYVQPVARNYQDFSLTMLNIKSNITKNLTLKLNGLYRKISGVSGIRNASTNDSWGGGDIDDRGGLMPINNLDQWVSDGVTYWLYPTYHTPMDITTKMAGLTLNKVVNTKTFWEFTAGYLISRNKTYTNPTRDTTKILAEFGPIKVDEMPYGRRIIPGSSYMVGDWEWNRYAQPPGIIDRFDSKGGNLYDRTVEQQFQLRFIIGSQINAYHFIKSGIEYNYFDLNMWQWKDWPGFPGNTYEFIYHQYPSRLGMFVQDQITFQSMIANIGLRFDYYDNGKDGWPTGDLFAEDAWMGMSDADIQKIAIPMLREGKSWIWSQLDSYADEHPGFYKKIKDHFVISPRIGVSFPVTERSKFYFNYGHFRSTVPFATMYLNKYRHASKNLIMELGNPDLEPPRTIAYELGIDYNLLDKYLIHVAGYYKDISGQHGDTRYISSSGILHYDFRSNNNYQDIQGVELSITKQFGEWLTGWINYQHMWVKSGYTGRRVVTEEATGNLEEQLYQGDESRPKPQPELSGNIVFHTPEKFGPHIINHYPFGGWSMSFLGVWRRGKYFTWNPLGKLHVENNLRWPDYYMVDFRLSKIFNISNNNLTFYVDIKNLFNIKVNYMSKGYPFSSENDRNKYLASLHLPMYNSTEFDALRAKNPGLYEPGNDKIGDLRSSDKPYINDPDRKFLLYGEKRQIWFGIKVDF